MTAVVDSFPEDFRDVEDGAGVGDGRTGLLQGGSGLPQRSRFPANEDTGNMDRLSGIDPES